MAFLHFGNDVYCDEEEERAEKAGVSYSEAYV